MTTDPIEMPAWTHDPGIHADALAQAFPYTEATSIPPGAESAWSARVQAAVYGMDAIDPRGLDAWMQAHADSTTPHLLEADLAATYETRLREATEAAELTMAWDQSLAMVTEIRRAT